MSQVYIWKESLEAHIPVQGGPVLRHQADTTTLKTCGNSFFLGNLGNRDPTRERRRQAQLQHQRLVYRSTSVWVCVCMYQPKLKHSILKFVFALIWLAQHPVCMKSATETENMMKKMLVKEAFVTILAFWLTVHTTCWELTVYRDFRSFNQAWPALVQCLKFLEGLQYHKNAISIFNKNCFYLFLFMHCYCIWTVKKKKKVMSAWEIKIFSYISLSLLSLMHSSTKIYLN